MDPKKQEELRKIREQKKEEKRRKNLQRRTAVVVILLAAAFCTVLYAVHHHTFSSAKSSTSAASAETSTSSPAEPQEEQQAEQDAASAAAEEAQTEQNIAGLNQEQLSLSGDRSVFAVDPANVPSNFDDNGEKTVYLSFDDGPSEHTKEVLDILDQYNAKATFFVTGLHQEYSGMIKEAYDRGHTIGLHTYSHDYAAV